MPTTSHISMRPYHGEQRLGEDLLLERVFYGHSYSSPDFYSYDVHVIHTAIDYCYSRDFSMDIVAHSFLDFYSYYVHGIHTPVDYVNRQHTLGVSLLL